MTSKIFIWDKMAKSFHEMSSRSRVLKDRYSRIADVIIKTENKSLLNLGCGSGLLEEELIKRGYRGRLCAVDASSEMLKLARKICGDRVDFRLADLNQQLMINEKFDVVVAMNVMFFLENKQQFLESVKGFLKNGSSIFILLNPKPNEESSIFQFILDHYKNTSLYEKFLITLNEIINMPRYIGMIRGQSHIWKMSSRGEITFHKQKDIIELANAAGLNIRFVEDYRASQSWLFVMELKK